MANAGSWSAVRAAAAPTHANWVQHSQVIRLAHTHRRTLQPTARVPRRPYARSRAPAPWQGAPGGLQASASSGAGPAAAPTAAAPSAGASSRRPAAPCRPAQSGAAHGPSGPRAAAGPRAGGQHSRTPGGAGGWCMCRLPSLQVPECRPTLQQSLTTACCSPCLVQAPCLRRRAAHLGFEAASCVRLRCAVPHSPLTSIPPPCTAGLLAARARLECAAQHGAGAPWRVDGGRQDAARAQALHRWAWRGRGAELRSTGSTREQTLHCCSSGPATVNSTATRP